MQNPEISLLGTESPSGEIRPFEPLHAEQDRQEEPESQYDDGDLGLDVPREANITVTDEDLEAMGIAELVAFGREAGLLELEEVACHGTGASLDRRRAPSARGAHRV